MVHWIRDKAQTSRHDRRIGPRGVTHRQRMIPVSQTLCILARWGVVYYVGSPHPSTLRTYVPPRKKSNKYTLWRECIRDPMEIKNPNLALLPKKNACVVHLRKHLDDL